MAAMASSLEEKSKGILNIGSHCHQCHDVDFLPFKCPECGNDYCSSHREPESHGCTRSDRIVREEDLQQRRILQQQQGSKTPPKINTTTPTNNNIKNSTPKMASPTSTSIPALGRLRTLLSSSTNKPRQSKTSSQTLLLDLKRSALGDASIPTDLRRYVYIKRPESTYIDPISGESTVRPEKTKALFFSKTWVIGRVLDTACQKLEVPNHNNSDPKKKVGLYKNGHLLQYGSKLGDSVKDGTTLVLQKVNND